MRRTPASGARFSVQLCALTAPGGLPRRLRLRFVRELRAGASFHVESAALGLGPGLRLGHRFVDAFDTDGNFLARLATRGGLNSPWGMARASYAFGPFSGDLLIGNFGNSWINALTPKGLVLLDGTNGKPLHIDGLWTLTPGGGANSKPSTLYFTAGPNGEVNGRFGTIAPAQ